MIKNIVFAGCSFTWGQSLHYHADFHDDIHPRDGLFYADLIKTRHYQYMVDNRFATKVADYFCRKSKVYAINGGHNHSICKNINQLVDINTDCIIVQTTAWNRSMEIENPKNIDEQLDCFLNLIKFYESKNILVRFIHYDVELIDLPNEILDRTIKIENQISFYNLLHNENSKYTINSTFNCPDLHFNQDGHNLIAKTLINYLRPYLSVPKYTKETII